MNPPGIAVKAFILDSSNHLLLIRRRPDDVHKPGAWEVPGGRLEQGEDPFKGLRRETMEETGLEIKIKNPLAVHHFTRDDNQAITMITFACVAVSDRITLSPEHTGSVWVGLEDAKDSITPEFRQEIEILNRFISSGII